MNKIIKTLCYILFFTGFYASAGAESKVVESLRGNAKFNTVAAVLIIIFVVLGITLFVLDRRISKLEKEKRK